MDEEFDQLYAAANANETLGNDENGFYVEPVIIEGDEQEGLIAKPIPEGLYKPRWNGEAWGEGLTQAEIDELKNAPFPLTFEEQIAERDAKIKRLESQNEMMNADFGALITDLISRGVLS